MSPRLAILLAVEACIGAVYRDTNWDMDRVAVVLQRILDLARIPSDSQN